MVKKNESDRRRRTADGKLIVRHHSMKTRRRRRNAHREHYINEVVKPKGQNKKSYLRFQNNLGKVLVAETRHLKGKGNLERANYEFAQNGQIWDTEEEALAEKARRVAACYADPNETNKSKCRALEESGAAKTQVGYGSDTIMRTFTGNWFNFKFSLIFRKKLIELF